MPCPKQLHSSHSSALLESQLMLGYAWVSWGGEQFLKECNVLQ